MKLVTHILVVVLLAACGKEVANTEQLKCGSTVYVNAQSKQVTWTPGYFEKACKINPDGTLADWNKLIRSQVDNTCGFWLQADGSLVTQKNKELTLSVTDYAACEVQ